MFEPTKGWIDSATETPSQCSRVRELAMSAISNYIEHLYREVKLSDSRDRDQSGGRRLARFLEYRKALTRTGRVKQQSSSRCFLVGGSEMRTRILDTWQGRAVDVDGKMSGEADFAEQCARRADFRDGRI